FLEEARDRALAGGDPSCQANKHHGETIAHCIGDTKVATIAHAMNVNLLDEAMKAQLALEWDRLRKALSQAGDIGDLNLEEVRVVADRDRRGLPPAVSVAAVQGALKLEKSGLRWQASRGGVQTNDRPKRPAGKAQAGEKR